MTETIVIRRAEARDRPAVLVLLSTALGWEHDGLFDRFFAWKHELNPFGPSAAWVATEEERVVGYRTFLRWEFEHPDGRTRRAVRAVDAATHPDYHRRGIFRRLTLTAIDGLREDRVDFVFNTPNERSGAGNLTMGWVEVGRLAAAVRPRHLRGALRMARSRVPADRMSLPVAAGVPAPHVIDDPGIPALLASLPAPRGVRTARSQAFLRWRYGFEELRYRALSLGRDPTEGIAIVRMRRRGRATEAAVCELLAPTPDARHALERAVLRAFPADYAISIAGPRALRAGFVPMARLGPILTYRSVNDTETRTERDGWDLQLGDIELL